MDADFIAKLRLLIDEHDDVPTEGSRSHARPEGRGRQLDLCLWPETTLRGCLDAYLHVVASKLAHATLGDYQDRCDWLCRALGDSTPLDRVTYPAVEGLVKQYGPSSPYALKLVTLRKRIRILRAAIGLQVDRGNYDRLWKMPRQLHDDGERGQDFYTTAEFSRFAAEVQDERHRRFYQWCFWTGHHAVDAKSTTRAMLNPDYAWRDPDGQIIRYGAYLRRNHKNKRAVDVWFPMEPEFRELSQQWLRDHPEWTDRSVVAGRISGVSRVARSAAEKAGLHYVTPNRGLRRSFATMLASRGYDAEYIRQAMAHEGRMVVTREQGQTKVRTERPTIDTAHYMRPSTEMLANAIRRAG